MVALFFSVGMLFCRCFMNDILQLVVRNQIYICVLVCVWKYKVIKYEKETLT